jgi:hypothetical protein
VSAETGTRRHPIACPRCRALIGAQQDWCLECGAAARTRLVPTPNWRLPMAIVAALATLAVLALLAAFFVITDDDPAPTPTAPPAAAPPPPVVPTTIVPTTTVPTTTVPTTTVPTTSVPTPTTTTPTTTTPTTGEGL